ncbi:MAG: Phosphoglycerate mutase [Cyanobacteria bacterium RYN_339]|nr:Phosphoglycerate mutase [Cyanobacteria bacterium RYN_339]
MPLHGGELVLVRHGESTANAAGIGQGRAEFPLSDLGRRQAMRTADHLATLGPFDALYASPQQRAAETAGAIGDRLGLMPHLDADLVEIDIGVMSGSSWTELEASQPDVMARYRQAEAERPHPRNRELIPGWEPIPAVVTRVWRAVAAALGNHPGGRVIVVAHGGVINAFLTHLLAGDAREVLWQHPSPNCAVSRITLDPAGPVAVCLTDDAHLAADRGSHTIFDAPKDQAL